MKHNIRAIMLCLAGCLCLLAACDLDKEPLAALAPDTYFSNEEELKLYSNKFYLDILPDGPAIYSENADMIIITPLNAAVSGQRTVPSTGEGWTWEPLRRINYLLANSDHTPDLTIRNQYNALARFFRAYFYFEKLRRFGEVPWFNKVLGSDDPELYKPRDSRDLIADSIIQDLDFAFAHLPETKEVYRVNKWTALALKSRVGLFEGTFRKYHGLTNAEKYLTSCVQASEQLINEGGYSLYQGGTAPYRDLFANTKAIGQEVILARDYDEALGLFHNLQFYENSSTLGRPSLAKSFVNTYLTTSGGRFTDLPGYDQKEFVEEMQNRDPRLAQTIRTPGYTRLNSTVTVAPNVSYTMTGYHLIKYSMEQSYDANGKSLADIPLFRIAETYLNFAEAKAELGTLTQADLDKSLNLLRARVSMPKLDMAVANATPDPYLSSVETGYPNVSGANKGVILEIRRERGIELVMEGHRYYDIMRWMAGKRFEKPFLGMYFKGLGNYDLDNNGAIDLCLYQGTKPGSAASLFLEVGKDIILTEGTKGNIIAHDNIKRTFREDRDYLYPIPSEEINLSNGVLKQNPNW
ncbi:RagB/SusD family nutrient uptake outer membrane protein [Chitinophaga agrisoli]|uniref:RagB/SusD family nutrient uptake outer membrane protein n=1 Tax=Chitinophaga agrisoli TaxID=2607653 RepID=A0A5B2VSP3_9BACT|nr:RagB/SusD family nutrient uptake outer membrane protein [Chitinophaga agrisoli]KAA2241302.1 RagB/SusD family nutrient uptake outer membrane protein [Chitinophaga agrisoli]